MRYTLAFWLLCAALLSACNGGTPLPPTTSPAPGGFLGSTRMAKAAYVDLSAVGSLAAIPNSGWAAPTIVLFAFADVTTPNPNAAYLAAMQKAVAAESSGTLNFLSLGGQNGSASTFLTTGISAVIANVESQIAGYKAGGVTIAGVDLDLEGPGWTSDTILQLATGFKANGLLVSVAPQVYCASGGGCAVDSSNPVLLGLTPSGATNLYGAAVAGGQVDYIMAQTYNTGGWTVDGYNEGQVGFFTSIAHALNSAVRASCAGVSTLCIANNVKILIGEPANAGAGGVTIFNPTGATTIPAYSQPTILGQLNAAIPSALSANPHVAGVMMWALGNDYLPTGYGDLYAQVGGFSAAIFGAQLPPQPPKLPYFILQVSNTGSSKYVSGSLVVNGSYYIFGVNGTQGQVPIAPGADGLWGTLPSHLNPATPNVVDSSSLDTFFSGGATSFTTSAIQINAYSSGGVNINFPDSGTYACAQGAAYTFQAGHSYNVLLNGDTAACQINQVN